MKSSGISPIVCDNGQQIITKGLVPDAKNDIPIFKDKCLNNCLESDVSCTQLSNQTTNGSHLILTKMSNSNPAPEGNVAIAEDDKESNISQIQHRNVFFVDEEGNLIAQVHEDALADYITEEQQQCNFVAGEEESNFIAVEDEKYFIPETKDAEDKKVHFIQDKHGNIFAVDQESFVIQDQEGNSIENVNEDYVATGDQEDNFATGDQEDNFATGHQEDNFATGHQEDNFATGDQEDNFATGDQEDNFATGDQEDTFATGDQKSDFIADTSNNLREDQDCKFIAQGPEGCLIRHLQQDGSIDEGQYGNVEVHFVTESQECKFIPESHEDKFIPESHEDEFIPESHEDKFIPESHEDKFSPESHEDNLNVDQKQSFVIQDQEGNSFSNVQGDHVAVVQEDNVATEDQKSNFIADASYNLREDQDCKFIAQGPEDSLIRHLQQDSSIDESQYSNVEVHFVSESQECKFIPESHDDNINVDQKGSFMIQDQEGNFSNVQDDHVAAVQEDNYATKDQKSNFIAETPDANFVAAVQEDNFATEDQKSNSFAETPDATFIAETSDENLVAAAQEDNFATEDQKSNFIAYTPDANIVSAVQEDNFATEDQKSNSFAETPDATFIAETSDENLVAAAQEDNLATEDQKSNFIAYTPDANIVSAVQEDNFATEDQKSYFIAETPDANLVAVYHEDNFVSNGQEDNFSIEECNEVVCKVEEDSFIHEDNEYNCNTEPQEGNLIVVDQSGIVSKVEKRDFIAESSEDHVAEIKASHLAADNQDSNLIAVDQAGNFISRVQDGNLSAKDQDSNLIAEALRETFASQVQEGHLIAVDQAGNFISRVQDGNLTTKNQDSNLIAGASRETFAGQVQEGHIIAVDQAGNFISRVQDGNLLAKNQAGVDQTSNFISQGQKSEHFENQVQTGNLIATQQAVARNLLAEIQRDNANKGKVQEDIVKTVNESPGDFFIAEVHNKISPLEPNVGNLIVDSPNKNITVQDSTTDIDSTPKVQDENNVYLETPNIIRSRYRKRPFTLIKASKVACLNKDEKEDEHRVDAIEDSFLRKQATYAMIKRAKSILNMSAKAEKKKKVPCPLCGWEFTNEAEMSNHKLLSHHSVENKFTKLSGLVVSELPVPVDDDVIFLKDKGKPIKPAQQESVGTRGKRKSNNEQKRCYNLRYHDDGIYENDKANHKASSSHNHKAFSQSVHSSDDDCVILDDDSDDYTSDDEFNTSDDDVVILEDDTDSLLEQYDASDIDEHEHDVITIDDDDNPPSEDNVTTPLTQNQVAIPSPRVTETSISNSITGTRNEDHLQSFKKKTHKRRYSDYDMNYDDGDELYDPRPGKKLQTKKIPSKGKKPTRHGGKQSSVKTDDNIGEKPWYEIIYEDDSDDDQ